MLEINRLGSHSKTGSAALSSRFGNGLARQTKREADLIIARADIAAVEEQAHAFLVSVAMTNVSVLVSPAETIVQQNPEAEPFLNALVTGYSVGASQRLNLRQ